VLLKWYITGTKAAIDEKQKRLPNAKLMKPNRQAIYDGTAVNAIDI
jgi:hypothetical protein